MQRSVVSILIALFVLPSIAQAQKYTGPDGLRAAGTNFP